MASHVFRFSLPGRETGLTPQIAIMRHSDRFFVDFNDSAFKGSAWVDPEADMVAISSVVAPGAGVTDGEYFYQWTIPSVAGVVVYEAFLRDTVNGYVARELIAAIDGQLDLSTSFPLITAPGTVVPNSLGQKWLGDLSLVFGDMHDIDSDSYVLKSVNGTDLVTFTRGQTGAGFFRTRV
jgi:hypothetical protein